MDERIPKQEMPSGQAPPPDALAGWCEVASRLLAPLLSSPQVKARLRILLVHIDPDYAPALVRTLFRTDPEIPLAALAALPRLSNVVIGAAAELTRALGVFPAALLGSFAEGLLGELRPRPLGEAIGRGLRLLGSLPSDGRAQARFWSELAAGFDAGYVERAPDPAAASGKAKAPSALAAHAEGLASAMASLVESHPELVASAARAIGQLLERHPELVEQGFVPLLAPLHDALHAAHEGKGTPR